jgi:hypothetical protein
VLLRVPVIMQEQQEPQTAYLPQSPCLATLGYRDTLVRADFRASQCQRTGMDCLLDVQHGRSSDLK